MPDAAELDAFAFRHGTYKDLRMKHVAVIPAHNESEFIGKTLDSLVAQTQPPDLLIVVDDGSTDATAAIVRGYAHTHPWIRLIQGPKQTERRYRVVEVFQTGYETVRDRSFTYVSKLDADLVFPKNYFERLFQALDQDAGIAAGSGILQEVLEDGRLMRFRMPDNHVPGALKTIRKTVFDTMGGFLPVLGWDILDLVKMRAMGYRTVHLPDIAVLHLRRHASATGIVRGNVRMGHGAYVIGTHPMFAIARSIYRMFEPPYVLGGAALGYGYFQAWLRRTPRIDDDALIGALRKEQLHRLLHFNRTPTELRSST